MSSWVCTYCEHENYGLDIGQQCAKCGYGPFRALEAKVSRLTRELDSEQQTVYRLRAQLEDSLDRLETHDGIIRDLTATIEQRTRERDLLLDWKRSALEAAKESDEKLDTIRDLIERFGQPVIGEHMLDAPIRIIKEFCSQKGNTDA